MRRQIYIISGFFLFLIFFMSIVLSWWNVAYSHRYKIIENKTDESAIAVNDTFGINTNIIWALTENQSYVYSTDTDFSEIAIATDTDQNNWENETSRTGNNPALVWNENFTLVSHYGENTGTVAYDSTLHRNGDEISTLYTTGRFGYGVNTTNDGYIRYNNTAEWNSSFTDKGNFSVEFWMYLPSAWTGTVPLVTKTDTTGSSVPFVCIGQSNFKIQCFESGAQQKTVNSNTLFDGGKWYYIVYVRNLGTGYKYLYVNGSLDNSASSLTTNIWNNYPLLVAKDTQGNWGYGNFVIDELRVHNISLSATYIQQQWWNGINNMTRLGVDETTTSTSTTSTTTSTSSTTTTIYISCASIQSCEECIAEYPVCTWCNKEIGSGCMDVCDVETCVDGVCQTIECSSTSTTSTSTSTTSSVTSTTSTTSTTSIATTIPTGCDEGCNQTAQIYSYSNCTSCVEALGSCQNICRYGICNDDYFCLEIPDGIDDWSCGCCCLTTTTTTTIPIIYGNSSYPIGCCPISQTLCVNNETLEQIWNISYWNINVTGFNISTAFVHCTFGCDTTLNQCRTSPIEEYGIYFLILIGLIVIVGIVMALWRRH